MKRTGRIPWGEIRVGLLLTAVIAVVLWASFSGGGASIFDDKVEYRAYFANAGGLVTGAPVWIAGIEVGNVSDIDFVNQGPDRLIEVHIDVLESIQYMITQNATVEIGTIGFIGDKYVEVNAGSLDLPMLEAGSEIPAVKSPGVDALFAEGQETFTSAQGLVKNLEEITDEMKAGKGTLGQMVANDTLYREMTDMVSALTVLIGDMQSSQKKIVSSIENISTNLDGITEKVNNNEGTIGKLVSDPGLFEELHSSAARVDSILAKINQGRGTAGAMVNDDEMYQEIKNLIVRVENLVSDIEKNPRKYFKFSVF